MTMDFIDEVCGVGVTMNDGVRKACSEGRWNLIARGGRRERMNDGARHQLRFRVTRHGPSRGATACPRPASWTPSALLVALRRRTTHRASRTCPSSIHLSIPSFARIVRARIAVAAVVVVVVVVVMPACRRSSCRRAVVHPPRRDAFRTTTLPLPVVGGDARAVSQVAHNATIAAGAYPSPLNYHGFPKVKYK